MASLIFPAERILTNGRHINLVAEHAVNGFFGGITTARTTDLWLPNAAGTLIQYGNGEVGIVDGNAIWSQPGATNLQRNSNAPTNNTSLGWTNTGGTLTPGFTTLVGINGCRAVRSAGGAALSVGPNGLVSLTGSTAGRTFTCSFWVRNNGGDTDLRARIIEDGGAQASASSAITLYAPTATPQRITFTVTIQENDRTGVRVLYAESAAAGDFDIICGGFQVEETGYETSWILTDDSAVTINATEPVVPWPSGLDSNFAGSFIWKPAAASQGTIWLLGNYTDANNAWGVLHDGTNVIFRNRVSGTDNDAMKALAYAADTEYLIHFRHDTVHGLDIAVDRAKGTNDSTTTAVTNATDTYLGQDGNDASHMTGSMRDIRIQKHAIGWSDSEWLAS